MNYTAFSFDNKQLASLSMGTMRWYGTETIKDIVQVCVDNNAIYIDTSPMYGYSTEQENSESWTGYAIKDMRDKVILSAKCSPGNGGGDIGLYDPIKGFSITKAEQVRNCIEQSLRRMNVEKLDCYQMWSVSNSKVYEYAFIHDGWMEGAFKAKEDGLFTHLGITGHPESDLIKRWVDDGYFEMITVPFNIIDAGRLEGVLYALEKGVAVIAMNPLAGGLLGGDSEVIAHEFANEGIHTPQELALKFIDAFGISCLCGMTLKEQAVKNVKILSEPRWSRDKALSIHKRLIGLMGDTKNLCTGCGYCGPCIQHIDIPSVLRLRNYYNVLKLKNAKEELTSRYKWWGDSHKADHCVHCGSCESKCPNKLPVTELLKDAMSLVDLDT